MFLWNGSIVKSIIIAFIISIAFWLLAYITKRIKIVRRDFPKFAILEVLAIFIYILSSIVSLIPFSHYFTVRSRKDIIHEKMITNIENAKTMFDDYEDYAKQRIFNYSTDLQAAINGKEYNQEYITKYGFNDDGESYSSQKERKIRIFEDDLMPAHYDSIKVEALKWLEKAKTKSNVWKPIGFFNVVNSIKMETNGWLSSLKSYSLTARKDEGSPFEYSISFASVEKELTTRSEPTLSALIFAITLLSLILFPYFIACRDLKSPGLINSLFRRKTFANQPGSKL